MLSCHQATQLLSRSQDEELTFGQRSQLRMHLLMCSACTRFSKQINSLRSISRIYARPGTEEDEKQ